MRDRVLREARLIISNHPGWGRRKINKALRAMPETGYRGLSNAAVDNLTRPFRRARATGAPELPPTSKVSMRSQQRVLHRAGFLPFEILGTRGSTRPPFGEVLADSDHPKFRFVIEKMIQQRYAERQAFVTAGIKQRWSKTKINGRWVTRIRNHYKKGRFPVVGGPVVNAGRFMTNDGYPSPWALFNAWSDILIKIDPFGGLGVGDTPKPSRAGRTPATRGVSPSVLRKQIREYRDVVRQLDVSIAKRGRERRWDLFHQHIQQRQYYLDTIHELEQKLEAL